MPGRSRREVTELLGAATKRLRDHARQQAEPEPQSLRQQRRAIARAAMPQVHGLHPLNDKSCT